MLVYLRDGTAGVPLKLAHQADDSETQRIQNWREVGLGAQILRELGIESIRLISSSKSKYVGLSGFGIEISSVEDVG